MSFYQFWVSQQTIPGNVLPDVVIGAATFIIGKYKVAPWLHQRHQEHLEQKERHHNEEVECHKKLFELHEKHHQEVVQQHQELLAQHQELLAATKATTAAHHGAPHGDGPILKER